MYITSLIKKILFTFALFSLVACGGNGNTGASSYISNANSSSAPISQALTFTRKGSITLVMGEKAINSATSPGKGALLYISSNPAIATVDSAGNVEVKALGTTTISAHRDADTQYLEANADYVINTIPATVLMTAWIGTDDTKVSMPDEANGISFYRSQDGNCNWLSYLECNAGQLTQLSGTEITDTAANYYHIGNYLLKQQDKEARLITQPKFSARAGHQVVTFNNQLWVIGGYSDKNDVWSSTDGITWTQKIEHAAFSARTSHSVIVFDNKLWLIGGFDDTNQIKNDVWSSSDGITWVEEVANAAFPPRRDQKVVEHNQALWLISGKNGTTGAINDVWSSTNGIIWTQKVVNLPFSTGEGFELTSYKGKLWLSGGDVLSQRDENAVWTSIDGITWGKETVNIGLQRLYGHKVSVYNDQLWLVAGATLSSSNSEVWNSNDGLIWTQKTPHAAFNARTSHALAVFNNKLWLIAGATGQYYYNDPLLDDVWSTTDGSTWSRAEDSTPFTPRYDHQTTIFNNKLWLIGGFDTDFTNDVLSSTDGIVWTKLVDHAAFTPRSGHRIVTFNNKLWVIGGTTKNGPVNDIWSSTDGVTWAQETNNAAFSARQHHQVVEFNSQLWLFGGETINGLDNGLWLSSNGINWTKQNPQGVFKADGNQKAVVFNNKIWLVGGTNSQDRELCGCLNGSNLWSSSDGITWVSQNTTVELISTYEYEVTVYNNQLWALGGGNGTYGGNAWVSSDGIIWRSVKYNAPFYHRANHNVITYKNRLYLIGGNSINGAKNDIWSSTDGMEWRKGFSGTFTFNK
jgi:hypothetical protein